MSGEFKEVVEKGTAGGWDRGSFEDLRRFTFETWESGCPWRHKSFRSWP